MKDVSIIIPTRNRLYAIRKTIGSYLSQSFIKEIIFVDDAGEDDLEEYLVELNKTSQCEIKYVRHGVRKGAASARNTGLRISSSDYVLFGEDDVYLGAGYVESLVNIIDTTKCFVSGRIIMLKSGESMMEADKRFGSGICENDLFDKYTYTINFDSHFTGNQSVPFTHALFMASRERLVSYGFDEYYFPGNGYREESDPQLQHFCDGGQNIITNEASCYHMARSEVKTGGQRISRIRQFYYCVKYNSYFFDKYYEKSAKRLSLTTSLSQAKLIFVLALFFKMFIQPLKKIVS